MMTLPDFEGAHPKMPRYYVIKQTIINWIRAGEVKPDDMLPTEHELMEKFNVSRITVRRALDDLALENYIYRIQGKGTYVSDISKLKGYSPKGQKFRDLIEYYHMVPERRFIALRKSNILPEDAKILKLKEGELVFVLERVYCADGIPVIFVCSYFHPEKLKGIEKFDLANNSLVKVYGEFMNLSVQSSNRVIKTTLVDEKIARYLEVDDGFPVLQLNYYNTVVGEEDSPIESARAYYRTDILDYLPDM